MHTQVLRDATGLYQALRSRRKELGLTQEELGQPAGLAAKHVSRIENGTHEPKMSTLFAPVDIPNRLPDVHVGNRNRRAEEGGAPPDPVSRLRWDGPAHGTAYTGPPAAPAQGRALCRHTCRFECSQNGVHELERDVRHRRCCRPVPDPTHASDGTLLNARRRQSRPEDPSRGPYSRSVLKRGTNPLALSIYRKSRNASAVIPWRQGHGNFSRRPIACGDASYLQQPAQGFQDQAM
jgi:DNA-binding XRE family transcriptional regulator